MSLAEVIKAYKAAKNAETIPDVCDDCKHYMLAGDEYPCDECIHNGNYSDFHEPVDD